MSRSQDSFNKRDREKKRLKKRQEKQQRKEARKANKGEESEFSYVDEYGNLTDTPPDPANKIEVDAEDIVLGIPKKEEVEEDPVHRGRVEFFNDAKGFGFIKDLDNGEKYFYHINNTEEEILENDKVTFEIEMGPKGPNAVRVKRA